MQSFALAVSALLAASSLAHAAGYVRNANFRVFTERGPSDQATQEFAQSVLVTAERYREEIAREWLGCTLPRGVGQTTINVTFSADRDAGLTWAVDHPKRRYHTVYLYTSADQAVGATLAHEMAHVVLATHFPHPARLPAWLEEGIASRYDDAEKKQLRAENLRYMSQRGGWVSLGSVLALDNILAEDVRSYAAASSLVEMLLSRGDKQQLLEFGQALVRTGSAGAALRQHYGIQDEHELQSLWQDWVGRTLGRVDDRLSRFVPAGSAYGQ